ncbi:GNAT family N-acetyltransferase [Flavobacterium mekongense]|uniref:GNAT family N-acetyltransferase n=1 Tax=Flavobacterium mekongense TaxID=3379707 RepID=UPI00399A9C3E
MKSLTFRKLTFPEFETLVSWAAREGWNPGLHDAELFYETDPEGFYGYFEQNTMIGGGSIVSYNGELGFMGFFIVHPEYRAKGIGNDLWLLRRDTLLKRLQPNAAIGMDGVVAMQPFYQKGGFSIAYRDERYEKKGEHFPANPLVQLATAKDEAALFALDLECFGVERKKFLKLWLNPTKSKTFTYTEKDTLLGFAVMRKCQTGFKIGPLFAENEKVAEALYERCLTEAIEEPVYLDIPLNNKAALSMVNKYKAGYVFECARMYYNIPPKTATAKVFGITSFELG